MKSLVIAGLILSFNVLAHADTLVCFAGQANADGSLAVMSNNPVQVLVLKGGAITPYGLKDAFSLFNTHYNLKNPLDLTLVNSLGAAGQYKGSGNAVTAEWTFSDDGKQKSSLSVSIDLSTMSGKLENNLVTDADGRWAGTKMDKLICTAAGTL